jgi:cytochrome c
MAAFLQNRVKWIEARYLGASGLCGVLALCFSLFAVSVPALAGVVKIELPPETASFKRAPGSELANGQCLMCHSVEYVVMQPPSPGAFWLGEVKKMRDKYGATVPEDQVAAIVNYLGRNYGTETNPPVAPTAIGSAPEAGKPLTPEATAALYGCLTCHSVDHKIVGPAYRDVAAKYRNDPEALAKIAEQIHKGGSGKWGPVIMPPFAIVSERDTKVLADWILEQK